MKLIPVISIFLILSVANGELVYGVFTDLVSVIFSGRDTVRSPMNPSWMVTLDWTLNGATVQPGDTFSLNMPCVFKFTSPTTTFDLEVDSIPYATCNMVPGELVLPYSEIDCTVLSTIRSTTEYSGQITIPLTFNVGGSDNANNLLCASKFSNGIGTVINKVTFSDGQNYLSTTANFSPGPVYDFNPSFIVYFPRVVPTLNADENYLLTGQCLEGYDSVTLGFNISSGLDCSTAAQALTTQLNGWYLPMTSFDTSFNYTCSNVSFIAEFTNISAGYRPYVSVLASPKVGQLFRVTYINVYRCAGTSTALNRSKSVSWGVYTNPNTSGTNGTAAEVIVVTSIWAQSTTGVTTLPYSSAGTKTIVVQIPTPSTTITSTWEESFTTTSTLSYVEGGTKTIVVEVPFPVITITNTIDGSVTSTTSTQPYTSGGTKTVIIDVPYPATTIINTIDGSVTSTTSTQPYTSGGTKTVIIDVPYPATTITNTIDGSVTSTTSTQPYTSGGTKTVIIDVPYPATTIINTIDGSVTGTTSTQPYTSGGTKTVIVDVPFPATTITNTIDGSDTSTTSIQPYTSGGTKTVIIDVPYPATTIINTIDGSVTSTTSTQPYTSGGTKTVIVDVPFPATTITNTVDDRVTSTTSTQPYTSGGTKTVIIDVPYPATTITNTIDGSVTSTTSTQPYTTGGTKTVIVDVPFPATTITNTWEFSTTMVSTLPYTNGGTKTVIVDVPTPIVTVTRYWDQSVTSFSTFPFTTGGTITVEVFVPTSYISSSDTINVSRVSFSSAPIFTTFDIDTSISSNIDTSLSTSSSNGHISPSNGHISTFSGSSVYSRFWNSSSAHEVSTQADFISSYSMVVTGVATIMTTNNLFTESTSESGNVLVPDKSGTGSTGPLSELIINDLPTNNILPIQASTKNTAPTRVLPTEAGSKLPTLPIDMSTPSQITRTQSIDVLSVSIYQAGTRSIKIATIVLFIQYFCVHLV